MNQPQPGSFEHIALAAIRPSATNPRKTFDPLALEELTRSVSEMGVTQPLLLRPVNPEDPNAGNGAFGYPACDFEIVSGERRFRAAKAAGLDGVPAIVRELSDAEARDIQMIENLQREDLHPVEEAEGYRALLAAGASPEDVAKKTGKTLAYVKQRIALLSLEVDAKQLFAAGHLTLDHALLLARLTPKDQVAAVLYLLGIRDWEIKNKDYAAAIAAKIKPQTYEGYGYKPDERKRLEAESAAKRRVNVTHVELRNWISSHVLLQLATAPWDLGDAELLPIAGPCTTCPKRSGANAALFQDLTTAEDVCTDPACFADKQKAFTARATELAKAQGSPLLKISAKRSHEKLEKPVVELTDGPLKPGRSGQPTAPSVKPVVVAKKAVKEGQWMAAKKGECPSTVQAIAVDGADQGKTRFVCADQKCPVHKHTVERPQSSRGSASRQESWEEQQKREKEKKDRYLAHEKPVREAVFKAIQPMAGVVSHRVLEYFIASEMDKLSDAGQLCKLLELPFTVKGKLPKEGWQLREKENEAARPVLREHVLTATLPELHEVAFHTLVLEALPVNEWQHDNKKGDREDLWALATLLGVDADTIAARVEAEQAAAEESAEAKPEKPAKKKLTAAEQKTRKASAAKKHTNAARKKVADAMKKRWAEAQKKKAEPKVVQLDRKSQGAGERPEPEAA